MLYLDWSRKAAESQAFVCVSSAESADRSLDSGAIGAPMPSASLIREKSHALLTIGKLCAFPLTSSGIRLRVIFQSSWLRVTAKDRPAVRSK
jgi:hypothetical protein